MVMVEIGKVLARWVVGLGILDFRGTWLFLGIIRVSGGWGGAVMRAENRVPRILMARARR
jgi:hypothetical protein